MTRSYGRKGHLGGLAALTVLLCAAGCTPGDTTTASSTASPSASTSTTAAAPGEYGQPVDPSAPNPTDVATDTAVTVTPGSAATLVVTYSGWNTDTSAVEVGGFVPGISESGGSCTLTLTKGGETATATAPVDAEPSQTTCGALAVPGSELAPGTWSAVVTFDSSGSHAESAAVEVAVP